MRCHLHIPPLAISLVIILSYYIYMLGFCGHAKTDILKTSLYVIFFNILYFMLMWSFLSTMFTPNATVPPEYHLTEEEMEKYTACIEEEEKFAVLQDIYNKRDFVFLTRTPHGHIRFCRICYILKPDRSHHCSRCRVCVAKMDHHCPWINSCIGFSNYKLFILTLFYCVLYCSFYLCSTFEYFLEYWHGGTERSDFLPIIIGFSLAAVLGSVNCIFLVYHMGLLLKNKTTLEALQGVFYVDKRITYNLGLYKNTTEVFGNKWRYWLFPVFSSKGNGCTFDIEFQLIPRSRAPSATRSHVSRISDHVISSRPPSIGRPSSRRPSHRIPQIHHNSDTSQISSNLR